MEDLKIIENNPILKPSDKTNTNYLANRKKIVKALEELPTEELEILKLYYIENLTLKEISEKMMLSKSKLSKIYKKAIKDIRKNYKMLKTNINQM